MQRNSSNDTVKVDAATPSVSRWKAGTFVQRTRWTILSEQQTGIIVGDGITYTDGTDLDSGDGSLAELVAVKFWICSKKS